jgi:hypothetical protein
MALPTPPAVLGGTVYTLVKDRYDDTPFDLLVIDEAGQVSLSNLLYMSRVARNILLVGDQQQLSQPNRAAHPGESGLSCIDYVMQNHAVVPADRGVFLATSWRMPPALTHVVSQLFYDDALKAAEANAHNRVRWDGPEQGLVFNTVSHSANSTLSEEEVDHIAELVERLLGRPFQRARLVNGQMQIVEGVPPTTCRSTACRSASAIRHASARLTSFRARRPPWRSFRSRPATPKALPAASISCSLPIG